MNPFPANQGKNNAFYGICASIWTNIAVYREMDANVNLILRNDQQIQQFMAI